MSSSCADTHTLVEQQLKRHYHESDISDKTSFIGKTHLQKLSDMTKGDSGDERVNDKSAMNAVSIGTMTNREDSKYLKCKYCPRRMSMLQKIEKVKSVKGSFFFGPHGKYSSRQNDQPKRSRGCQTPACLYDRAEMTYQEMRRLSIMLGLRAEKSLRTETFCKCVTNGWERDCRCGEEDKYFEWVWDTAQRGTATSLKEQGSLVVFHEDYSCGTTAIRGLKSMDKDQHFWEIKMTTPVYGTDMMIGIGTKNVELNKFQNTFCSMLGSDLDSWGISYDGRVQHGGRKWKYCSRFGQGTIIGVHLDMWHGTLTFFKNRQSLGVAFGGLRGRTLYPMVCSTAARSGMRVISSRSFPSSLQFLCCQILRQFIPSHLSVLDSLPMPPGLRYFLANNMAWLLDVPHKSTPNPISAHVCHICMPLKSALVGHTDDESSSDEERIDHIISFRDSDDDSEEEDPLDFSERALQRHSVARYLMHATLRSRSGIDSLLTSSSSTPPEDTSFSSGSSSDTAPSSFSNLSVISAGASTRLPSSSIPLRQPVSHPDHSSAKKSKLHDSLNQEVGAYKEAEETSDCVHETQAADLPQGNTEAQQKCQLGKRKHT